MCTFISSLLELKNKFDVFAFDQWGVLHDGKRAYEGAINCVMELSQTSSKIYIITNSGKRENDNLNQLWKNQVGKTKLWGLMISLLKQKPNAAANTSVLL